MTPALCQSRYPVQNEYMTDGADCFTQAIGAGVDPSGLPWQELDPALLRESRNSIKWTRYPADVLPLFVAEMDFAVAPEIRRAIIRAVEASDTGYLAEPGPLAGAVSDYTRDRWGWEFPAEHTHLATDVATGLVESLRVFRPAGGKLALSTPCYPGFFEMLLELNFEIVEIPLLPGVAAGEAGSAGTADTRGPAAGEVGSAGSLNLTAIEAAFAGDGGIDAFILCNPHNPHGIPFGREELSALAGLAAAHDVFVVSDEIHAPLTHAHATFTPFAPLAAEAGALSVTTTSASKGWNLAGSKCSVIVAADDRANALLNTLPPEVATRTSILGLHANVAAFTEARDWLSRATAQIEANQRLLRTQLSERVPGIGYLPGSAGYLAWLDLRGIGLGENPAERVLQEARVALNNGSDFGLGGDGHARLNMATSPHTLVQAIDRIAELVSTRP